MAYVPILYPSVFYDSAGTPFVVPTAVAAAALPATVMAAPIPPKSVDPVHVAALIVDAAVMVTVHPTLGIQIAPTKAPGLRR